MKRLSVVFLAIMICLVSTSVFAASYDIGFRWQQAAADFPNLEGWKINRIVNGSVVHSVTIPYTGGNGPFTSTTNFTIPVNPGVPVTEFFSCTAVSKNGRDAAPSNVVQQVFEVPFDDVGSATMLEITATVRIDTAP